jgi:hypothetical protein
MVVTSDFPTPPFPLTTPTTCLTSLSAFAGMRRLSFSLDAQFAEQLAQSWVHSDIFIFLSGSIHFLSLLLYTPKPQNARALAFFIQKFSDARFFVGGFGNPPTPPKLFKKGFVWLEWECLCSIPQLGAKSFSFCADRTIAPAIGQAPPRPCPITDVRSVKKCTNL